MINKETASVRAILTVAKLFSDDYVRTHYDDACKAYPAGDDVMYDFFIGFEGDLETDKWTVFADMRVNREAEECYFLDYKLPDGTRMKNPIRPVRRA